MAVTVPVSAPFSASTDKTAATNGPAAAALAAAIPLNPPEALIAELPIPASAVEPPFAD